MTSISVTNKGKTSMTDLLSSPAGGCCPSTWASRRKLARGSVGHERQQGGCFAEGMESVGESGASIRMKRSSKCSLYPWCSGGAFAGLNQVEDWWMSWLLPSPVGNLSTNALVRRTAVPCS